MSLIDLFKGFHHDAIQREAPPSARVLFDTFIYKLNEAHWVDSLAFSERDLVQLTGLKKTTLHEAKHYLTSRYIIECKPFKNKTMYSLGDEMLKLLLKGQELIEQPTTSRPLADQSATSKRPVSDRSLAHPIKRACEDVKTLDVKTDLTATTSACANSQELDNVLDYWVESGFGKLTAEVISKLEVQLRRYGLAEIRAAMDAAKLANGSSYGVSYNFFAKVLENRQSPKSAVKGGEKVAKSSTGFSYKPVTFDDGEELW